MLTENDVQEAHWSFVTVAFAGDSDLPTPSAERLTDAIDLMTAQRLGEPVIAYILAYRDPLATLDPRSRAAH